MPDRVNSRSTLDFLGTIGSTDRGDGVKMNNTARALVKLADFLITEASENLDKTGHVATGATISSMKARDIEINGSRMELDVEIASTYKFLNDGVKGVKSGTGKYSFKNIHPSKKMALAILKWIKTRRVVTKYKAISNNEKKNKKIQKLSHGSDSQKSLAYAIATNIKKKGIRPTKFWTNAVKETQKQKGKIISEGFKLDIIETIGTTWQ